MDLSIVLTPTRRLSARLSADLSGQFAATHQAWLTPSIFAIEDWFLHQWDKFEITGKVDGQLLTTTQSLLRWEWIIRDSTLGKTLLRPYSSAKLAFEAWKMLHQWQCTFLLERDNDNIDQKTFQGWALSYRDWLHENHYIDIAQLPTYLLGLLLTLPARECILYGFEELTPALQSFMQTLREHGWDIQTRDPLPIVPEKISRQSFASHAHEYGALAQWAKALVDRGEKNIAIVVPDLATHRQTLETLFTDLFDPFAICNPIAKVSRFVNFSAAIPFIQYPIVYRAITILKAETIPSTKAFSQWAEKSRHILSNQDWLNDNLNSIEYQCVVRWHQLLDDMATIDTVLGPVEYHGFIHHLEKLAANIPFQPQDKGAPIQILGVLEAAGQAFDHLWFMGLHSEVWPPAANPNPFICQAYQRQHQLPHASPEREMKYASLVTQRLWISSGINI